MNDFPGYEWLYAVTKDWNIWSHPKNWRDWFFMKQNHLKDWYMQVSLRKNNVQKDWKVHRIVALTYIPNPENKRTVNHKNKIRNDNRLENLEWNTHGENAQHGWNNGREVTDNIMQNMAKAQEVLRKKVMQLTKEGILCRVYNSTCEAERITWIDQATISRSANDDKGMKRAWWYFWKFLIA